MENYNFVTLSSHCDYIVVTILLQCNMPPRVVGYKIMIFQHRPAAYIHTIIDFSMSFWKKIGLELELNWK